ncbi:MAG: long-chain fatty acid--CoA ligase [Chloroflexi bacterium]|nr:long-chain fatty acid--CoA ligase [Chloroflexota bacterium]
MEDTFPKLLVRNYQRWGARKVALRKKEQGIWKEYNWEDCYQKVKALALGLETTGLARGRKVSILGDSNPEWLWSELAVQTVGGAVIGLNPSGSLEEFKSVLQQSATELVLAQDQEQVDKLLEIKDELPSLKKIVYWHEKGLRRYENPILVSLADVIKLGEEYETSHPEHFEESIALGKGDDVAVILYSPGTDGLPKAVPETYKFLLSSVESAGLRNPIYEDDEYVSVMNPGWFFEQTIGFGACLLLGQKLNFPEKSDTAPQDLREISPQTLVYPSIVWDMITSGIQENIAKGTWLKRTLFKRSMSIGYKIVDLPAEGRRVSVFKRLWYLLARLAVFYPLKDKHGLNKARAVYAAGNTVSPETRRFFGAIGVNLQQIFGSIEDGIVSVQPEEKLRLE